MIHKTLGYLYGLRRFGMKLGLEATQKVVEILGNPQKEFKSIHIAGTNGKSSTAVMIARVLQEAGYKVGLYTSPHLVKFNERIQVNGEKITDEELVQLTDLIKDKLADKVQPTFFEFTTALAFLHFVHKKVDIAVVEVGLGGRLDATNVLNPLVGVITNIGLEHEQHLGDTLEKIAKEKAEIIKQGSVIVTAEKEKNILDYFAKICKERDAELFVVQEKLPFKKVAENFDHQEFEVSGLVEGKFSLPLLGDHQLENACTAMLALHLLDKKGVSVPKEAIQKGLKGAKFSGRLEVVSKEPLIIVDGAHNAAGMMALCNYIKKLPKRKLLVLGISKDKNITEMMKLVVPLFEEVIVTQGNFKPTDTSVLATEGRKYIKIVHELPKIEDALLAAHESVEKDELLLVTGSIYMVGDALAALKKNI